MTQSSIRKLAAILKVLVTVTLICNFLTLPMVPALVWYSFDAGARGIQLFESFALILGDSYTLVLTTFLWFCGCCTAVILWQGLRVLDTVLRGEPFSPDNAVSMKRAAVCAWLIAGAALIRLIWGFAFYRSALPLLTYNALFVPIFAMAGLLAMVMSALFRQAAELKAENDLTI